MAMQNRLQVYMQAWTSRYFSEKKVIKTFIFVLSLAPLFWLLIALGLNRGLGANPVQKILHTTGDWAVNFLLITLSITPIQQITGWMQVVSFRRMLGLFSFFYASIHFLTYVGIDQAFSWNAILQDVIEHKRIIVGFVSFILLILLAATSTGNMVKHFGYKRWKAIHRLAYASAAGGVIHYILLVKKDMRRPLLYAAVLAILLGYRAIAHLFNHKRV